MLTIPTDLFSEHFGPSIRTEAACAVAYHAKTGGEAFAVLVTQPTLVHVRRGTKILPPLGGQSPLVIREGHMVLIPTGMQYMSEILPDEGTYQSTVLSFEPSFLAKILPDIAHERSWRHGCLIDPVPELQTLIQTLPQGVHDGLDARLLALRLEEIALRLSRHPQSRRILADAIRTGVGDARLLETMQHHFHQPLQLNEFAILCGRSLSSFKRDFKQHFGTSPGRWLIKKRLDYATQLLGNPHTTVTEVCFACGFGDLSHFIRSFGQHYNVSPKQWQRQRLSGSAV